LFIPLTCIALAAGFFAAAFCAGRHAEDYC
jgi:hypothetical protein